MRKNGTSLNPASSESLCTKKTRKEASESVREKITRKVRFFPLFPYGFCSKNATAIEGKQNPYASLFLAGDDPDGLIELSDSHRSNTLKKAQRLCVKNYAKNIQRTCGTPAMKRSFRALTKLGLAILVEAPDEAAADDAEDTNETSAFNGKIKEDYFRSGSIASTELRETLIETAGTEHQAFFNETLLDAVAAPNPINRTIMEE